MRKVTGIMHGKRKYAFAQDNVEIASEPSIIIKPPFDRGKPRACTDQGVNGFALFAKPVRSFQIPGQAKPSGLAGPVGLFGKAIGAAAAAAGLSRGEATEAALVAFAARSFLALSSCTARS